MSSEESDLEDDKDFRSARRAAEKAQLSLERIEFILEQAKAVAQDARSYADACKAAADLNRSVIYMSPPIPAAVSPAFVSQPVQDQPSTAPIVIVGDRPRSRSRSRSRSPPRSRRTRSPDFVVPRHADSRAQPRAQQQFHVASAALPMRPSR